MRDEDTIAVQHPSHANREVLYSNEAFAIGTLVVVSLALVFAFIDLSGGPGGGALMVALTATVASLACAAGAAFLRHDHAKWLLKAAHVQDHGERQRRLKLGRTYRKWMRQALLAAIILQVFGLLVFIVGLWIRFASSS